MRRKSASCVEGEIQKKSAKIVGYDGMPLVKYFSHGK